MHANYFLFFFFFAKIVRQSPRECCWVIWAHLPSPLLRTVTGENAHGDHGCQLLFLWCQRMIGFMDPCSALWQHRGHLATPGTRHTGRMWNVSEQGCSRGHSKTCHPSPLVIKECTARPCATHEEYWVWISLLFHSDLVFVCFSVRLWWICRQQCPGLKRETATTPFRQLMFGWIVWSH